MWLLQSYYCLCSSHWTLERDFRIESLFWGKKKRHYLLKEHCRDWGKLSHPQRSPPAFTSSSIRGGYMQGKGYEVIWHAMQHFSLLLFLLLHRCSWIIHNRAVNQCSNLKHAVCTAPNIQFTDSSLYIYTLYMICLVHCKCMMELHEGITLLNTDSCTSFCVGKNTRSNSHLL